MDFFFLQDLIENDEKIKFHLPFDGFKTKPKIVLVNEYLVYKENVENFIQKRNKRIQDYTKTFVF